MEAKQCCCLEIVGALAEIFGIGVLLKHHSNGGIILSVLSFWPHNFFYRMLNAKIYLNSSIYREDSKSVTVNYTAIPI